MKTSTFFQLAACLLFVLFAGINTVQAQGVEGIPEYTFLPYDDCDFDIPPCGPMGKTVPASLRNAEKPSVAASPNPGTDGVLQLFVSQLVGASTLYLVDVAGRIHARTTVGSDYEHHGALTLSTGHLLPGVYFVVLKSGAFHAVEKVMIH
ncbi:MAG: hypothetical protein OHK0039_25370 [Bacteroidia bacterium]